MSHWNQPVSSQIHVPGARTNYQVTDKLLVHNNNNKKEEEEEEEKEKSQTTTAIMEIIIKTLRTKHREKLCQKLMIKLY